MFLCNLNHITNDAKLYLAWVFLVAFVAALFQFFISGNTSIFQAVATSCFDSAKTGFEVSIGLTGVMTFWLGIVKVGEKSGLVGGLSKLLSPFLGKFFQKFQKDILPWGKLR